MLKITTFNDRPVRHVRYMPDGSVILKFYERRRPEKTPLHRTVSENLESWLACRDRAERPVPGHVEEELRGYLECGILCFGFARALHGLRPGFCRGLLLQGTGCASVLQRQAHGADRRPSR